MRNMKLSIWLAVAANSFGFCSCARAQAPTPLASPTPVQVETQSLWLQNLTSQFASAKEIHFDAVLNGTDGDKILPPIEVSGVLGLPDSMNVTIAKSGKPVCQIVGNAKSAVLYSTLTHRYFVSAGSDLSFNGSFSDLGSFAHTQEAQFVVDQVGKYSQGSFVLILYSLAKLDSLLKVMGYGTTAPFKLDWIGTQSNTDLGLVQHEAATIKSTTGDDDIETLNVDYTQSPWSIKHFRFALTGTDKGLAGTADVVYKQCDLIPSTGTLSDPTVFEFAVPNGALAWIPPQSKQ